MARKQKELPGMEKEVFEDVENAAEAYVATTRKRQKLAANEVADKTALIAAMQARKLKTYKLETGQVVNLTEGKLGVRVVDVAEEEPPELDA